MTTTPLNLTLNNADGDLDGVQSWLAADTTTVGERIESVLLAYAQAQHAVAEDYLKGGDFEVGRVSGTDNQAFVNLDDYSIVLEGDLSAYDPNLSPAENLVRLTFSEITITRVADGAQVIVTGTLEYSGLGKLRPIDGPNGSFLNGIELVEDGESIRLDLASARYTSGVSTGLVRGMTVESFGVADEPHYVAELSLAVLYGLTGIGTSSPSVELQAGSYFQLDAGVHDDGHALGDSLTATSLSAFDFLDQPLAARADTSGPDNVSLTGDAGVEIDTAAGDDTVQGSPGADDVTLGVGNDIASGNGGNDVLDGGNGVDIARFIGDLADYTLVRTGATLTVADGTAGRDGTDTTTNFERLEFADMSVNLTVQAAAASISVGTLDRICELYVGFFGRVPAADGLENWINQFKGGKSLTQIANEFYGIGSSADLREYTGYWDFTNNRELSNQDFVKIAYRNVLGREGLEQGVNYWADQLGGAQPLSRGELVSRMLDAAQGLEGDANWGWVADLLDDKVTMSKDVSIAWGLNYASTAQGAIEKGMAIAGAVTESPNPNPAYASIPVKTFDFEAAVELIGINPEQIDLIA